MVERDEIKILFSDLVRDLATRGKTIAAYRKRGSILLKIFDHVSHPNINVVDCQLGLEEAAEKILADIPSFVIDHHCGQLQCDISKKK